MAGLSNEQTEHTEAITKKNQKEVSGSTSKIWSSIIKNYEMIQGAPNPVESMTISVLKVGS